MKRGFLLLASCVLLLPMTAAAAETQVFDFRNKQVPGTWEISNWAGTEQTDAGLHIRADSNGYLIRQQAMPFDVDEIILTVQNAKPAEVMLLWRATGGPDAQTIQLPFSMSGDEPIETIAFDMHAYPEWNPDTDSFGLGIPKDADFVLQEIRLSRLSLVDKILEGTKAFWTFDTYRPYSINFLWGPLLTYSPSGRAQLFDNLPPLAQSGNRIFYALMAIAAVALLADFFRRPSRRQLQWFMMLTLGLWVIFDIRMGAELLSYAKTDYQRFIGSDGPTRVLRNYENFHAVAEEALSIIPLETKQYGLIVPPRTQLSSMIRYLGYPRLPVTTYAPNPDIRYWLMFLHRNTSVDASGSLVVDGTMVSPKGKIIRVFDDHSFLYESAP